MSPEVSPVASASARAPHRPVSLRPPRGPWVPCLGDVLTGMERLPAGHLAWVSDLTFLCSPRAEVRDPPEGDRQGRTSVHSHLHAGFFSSPPGKVRMGRRVVAFPGGASPSSQRNWKDRARGPSTLPTHRAWYQEIARWAKPCCIQVLPPPPAAAPLPLAPRKQASHSFPLRAKCLAWAWRSDWSWGSFPVRCRSPGHRAGKVWVSLWTPLAKHLLPLPSPVLGRIPGGGVSIHMGWMERCGLKRRDELSGSGSKLWAEWGELTALSWSNLGEAAWVSWVCRVLGQWLLDRIPLCTPLGPRTLPG